MGIPDSSLLDQIDKVRSWISWGTSDISSFSGGQFEMPQNSFEMCCECDKKFTELSCGYHCEGCQQCSCAKCSQCYESPAFAVQHDGKIYDQSVKSCKFCDGAAVKRGSRRKYYEKVHPSVSPRESPETPSPCSVNSELNQGDRFAHYLEAHDCECSPHVVRSSIMSSFGAHLSQLSIGRSPSRSDNGAKDYETNILSPLVKFGQDTSDLDSGSVSPGHEFNSFRPVGSSPSVSPSRNNFTPNRVGHPVHKRQEGSPLAQNLCLSDQASMAILRRPDQSEEPENLDDCTDYMSVPRNQFNKSFKILDLESNGLMWYPPPPEDEDEDVESSFFSYDDEDDDVGDSCAFSSSSSLSSTFLVKEKQNERGRRPVRAVIRGHFRALVLQLLQCEGIKIGKEDGAGDWLDIVTSIAWQAANFVKPDTSRGGSMDPGDYVKVKCIASGKPSESTLVKGVVCTKNIKHKQMTSQFRNPRLFLLGGSLEFQKVPSQLASFNTLLEQEHDHLKMIITKIESLRPNVLLVEKSVSSCAQEYLLAKNISLVLNVKRPQLERIARCTGANICPSIDKIPATHLGHCELFRIERVSEELETANKFNRKHSKTLMFFDGCPRCLGCTVLLRGTSREELKKIKHVVQYAVFAAYHLSLETSYLADEGATLPMLKPKHSIALTERAIFDDTDPAIPIPITPSSCQEIADARFEDDASPYLILQHGASEFFSEHHGETPVLSPSYGSSGLQVENVFPIACNGDLEGKSGLGICLFEEFKDLRETSMLHRDSSDPPWAELQGIRAGEKGRLQMATELKEYERITGEDISSECFPASDMNQSILISFSSRCILKGVVCERSRLLRIKYYGCFDKPLGRYLLNDLFDQTSFCRSCKEPSEAHVICYTHQQGNLTINVRRLASVKLPGERDGKIWMWHRCLRCAHINGVPPATRRVVMSDAAWGLSFGKFLELSFSNHATANRIATCGHSLQRDCLRYYGSGSMVAFFRYSPIDIFSVHVPPPVLEFSGGVHQEWIRKDTIEFMHKVESLYQNIADVLDSIEQRSNSNVCKSSDRDEVWNHIMNHIMELKDQLRKERNDCNDLLQPFLLESSLCHETVDILELNRLRHELVIGSHVWDSQLHTLDSLLKVGSAVRAVESVKCFSPLKELRTDHSRDQKFEYGNGEIFSMPSELRQPYVDDTSFYWKEPSSQNYESVVREEFELGSCFEQREDNLCSDWEVTHSNTFRGSIDSPGSTLSDRIDSAWTGTDLAFTGQPLQASQDDGLQASLNWSRSKIDYPPRLASPMRVHSFNSALRFQDKIKKGLPSSSISPLKSFHASGDYISMVRDPVSNMGRTFSNTLPFEAQKLNFSLSRMPSSILCAPGMAEGAWLFLPLRGPGSVVISVYDNDPASIISYALSMEEYEEWLADTYNENAGCWGSVGRNKAAAATFSALQSFGSIDLDYMHYGRYGSEDVSPSVGTVFSGTKRSPHLTLSFGDDTASACGKVQFFVTCYFAKQFDSLRKRCCPSELNLLRSLSRCQKWSAQGGKSNVYFAKSMDDRFIIKQVKKTELESFQEFAPEYFNYMTDSLSSGSPTCLTKILGIYQVCVKHLKGGRETKMDLMVMENLFFQRSISKVYDLKGSACSRYNPDTAGANKVLLDMNMLETLRTEPIFLGSKAKRSLERAIWNDTNFLASVDVMDYSLLVGVDDEHKELVLGIIDFMRQYTWDKHLETWVKASGILGGPKNTSPTIVSPKQYKKRFRKAMTSYFLTVPEQWTS